MTTIEQLISSYESDLREAERTRDRGLREARAISDAARRQGRTTLTEAEDVLVERSLTKAEAAKKAIAAFDVKLKAVREAQAAEDELAAQAHISIRDPKITAQRPSYDRVARIGREERIYRPDRDPSGKDFLMDVARHAIGLDAGAVTRIQRHQHEEEIDRAAYLARGAAGYVTRAAGTAAFSGLVVPQYLTDQYAPQTATLRPIADVCTQHPLPEQGMSIEISRITTGSSVANQASENTAVSETNMDDTLLTLAVKTAGGQQTVSRQAVERGAGIEDVTLLDLFRKYAVNLDTTIITDGTIGLAAVAQGTTYTDADPTAPEFWPYMYQAQSKLEAALVGVAMPDYIAMHSRRWNWLCSQVGTSVPFLGARDVPPQMGGVIITNEYGAGVRGVLSNGMKVIVDNNIETTISTNQDPVYVLASGELHLFEDPGAPVLIRCEQTHAASLGILYVVYGYYAFTASRYANNPGRITGTGLAAPSGF